MSAFSFNFPGVGLCTDPNCFVTNGNDTPSSNGGISNVGTATDTGQVDKLALLLSTLSNAAASWYNVVAGSASSATPATPQTNNNPNGLNANTVGAPTLFGVSVNTIAVILGTLAVVALIGALFLIKKKG